MAQNRNESRDEKEYNFYQNITSKFNILHNARLMLDEQQLNISRSKKINYQIRQDVFDNPEDQQIFHTLMDSVIRKTYKVIHDKTESKYIDEAYFLIGRANYLKGAFHTANEYFSYLIRHTEDAERYLPLAYAWKSRALHQTGRHEQAALASDSALIFMMQSGNDLAFVHAAKAHSLITTEKELDAISYLESAVKLTRSSADRHRWTYLLAQLYAENEDKINALKNYKRISRANVPFEMAFEASLQVASRQTEAQDSVDNKVKPLQKMLREGKNNGYQDRIYHQIGRLYLEAKKDNMAVDFFNKSLQQQSGNPYQATETYMVLADHYFEKKQYRVAQSYYDLVASTIPTDYTNVDQIRRKLIQMTEITERFENIAWQDTLLHLATLSETDRDKTIGSYAEKNRADIVQRKQQKVVKGKSTVRRTQSFSMNSNATQSIALANMQQTTYSGDKFYFNNPDAMSLGQSDFRRRWGNRALTDNWRFNAQTQSTPLTIKTHESPQEDPGNQDEPIDEDLLVENEKNRLIQAVPNTQDEIEKLNTSIHDNLLTIANIYRDYTKDAKDATQAFEQFLTRYPNTHEGPYAYYSLYRLYADFNEAKSKEYRNRLITLFPESLHARVALDPHYLEKMDKEKKVLDREFEKIFTLYTEHAYPEVIEKTNQVLTQGFSNDKLLAQMDYLKALAIGHLGNTEAFTNALTHIVQNYPQDSLVSPLASEHLAYIQTHPELFAGTHSALHIGDDERIAFINQPDITPWPQLIIRGDYRTGTAIVKKEDETKEERIITGTLSEVRGKGLTNTKKEISIGTISGKVDSVSKTVIYEEERLAVETLNEIAKVGISSTNKEIATRSLSPLLEQVPKIDIETTNNDYRDSKLFPERGIYYFVIHVIDPSVNLAPSRYGIGQFNRSRYARSSVTHRLSQVNNEKQLIYIGTFTTYRAVKEYESRIRPMLAEIMKIPQENYNIFVVTKELLETLTDGTKIDDYQDVYSEQP